VTFLLLGMLGTFWLLHNQAVHSNSCFNAHIFSGRLHDFWVAGNAGNAGNDFLGIVYIENCIY
jgi:hypothetical protein